MKYFPPPIVCADLVAVVVGGAPAQRHGQGVGEGLLGVAAGGQTQGLDVPGHGGHKGARGHMGARGHKVARGRNKLTGRR